MLKALQGVRSIVIQNKKNERVLCKHCFKWFWEFENHQYLCKWCRSMIKDEEIERNRK